MHPLDRPWLVSVTATEGDIEDIKCKLAAMGEYQLSEHRVLVAQEGILHDHQQQLSLLTDSFNGITDVVNRMEVELATLHYFVFVKKP